MDEHILVVDDDDEIRALLQDLLEGEMYIVDTANDGRSALDKIIHQRVKYTVILLDLAMPGMNGLQLIQLLRQREETRLYSIIALSADQEALRVAANLGIRQCLAKPFDLETILTLVSSCRKQHLQCSSGCQGRSKES